MCEVDGIKNKFSLSLHTEKLMDDTIFKVEKVMYSGGLSSKWVKHALFNISWD